MSVTASSRPERGAAHPLTLFVVWAVFSAAMSAVMWRTPGEETIPFHLIYIAFCLLYGLAVWPTGLAILGIVALVVVSSAALGRSVAQGAIGWTELSEVPFMATLALLLVWHIRRRQQAAQRLNAAMAREVSAADHRQLLTRLISHELRTSLTITAGYTDLIATQSSGRRVAADVSIVSDELTRLNRSVERLITMIRLQEEPVAEPVDLDALLHRTARRWVAVQPREWSVVSDVGRVLASEERLSAALDTLVENALRHTSSGDLISLRAHWVDGQVAIEVRDSGVGLSDEQVEAINLETTWTPSTASHSGLGLNIVRQVVQARSGTVTLTRVPAGGTRVVLRIPLTRAPHAGGVLAHLQALPTQAHPGVRTGLNSPV